MPFPPDMTRVDPRRKGNVRLALALGAVAVGLFVFFIVKSAIYGI